MQPDKNDDEYWRKDWIENGDKLAEEAIRAEGDDPRMYLVVGIILIFVIGALLIVLNAIYQ